MLNKKQIRGIIDTHRTKATNDRRDWDRWRAWYLSEYWGSSGAAATGATPEGGDEEVNFQTNYPYAYVDTMIANVCPHNPQVTVMARQEELHPYARFREALINDSYSRNSLHHLLWKMATNVAICGRGFLKTVWNFQKKTAEIFEIDPRCVFFDMSASRWEDIRYLVEVTVLTQAEFQARTKRQGRKGAAYNPKAAEKANFGGYPAWLKDNNQNESYVNEASTDVYKWVTVYEVYDFTGDGKYYHMLDNVEDPLFEGDLPYRYVRNPFSYLTFNENMKDLGGLSDIKLIQSLQERLNEIDTLELWHAQSSNPVMLVNTALVDNPEDILTGLQDANQPGSMISVQGKANAPLRDLIGVTPTPTISPSYDVMRNRCNQVIEFTLGIPQYSRGVVGVADIATEVALADSATRTRNGRRIKSVEDVVTAIAHGIVGLYEEFLTEDSTLPLRLTGSQEVLEASRIELAFRDSRDPNEIPMDYDYIAVPYSPTENNRLMQLQKLQQYLPILQQSTAVDQQKLIMKLLELLQLSDIIAPPPPPAPPAPPGMPGMPPGMEGMPPGAPPGGPPLPMPPDGGQDVLGAGGLPPGMEAPPIALPAGGPGLPAPKL